MMAFAHAQALRVEILRDKASSAGKDDNDKMSKNSVKSPSHGER